MELHEWYPEAVAKAMASGKTPEDIASGIGVSRQTVYDLAKVGANPRMNTLRRVYAYFGKPDPFTGKKLDVIDLRELESTRCYDHTELDLREREPVLVLA